MSRRRILFGPQAERQAAIARVVDGARFDCDFVSFAEAKDRYDAVLPMTLDQQADLAADPGRFGDRFLVPSAETQSLCHDKVRFNRLLIREGFGALVPRMSRPRAAELPFVLKRRRDEFGQRSVVVADEATLAAAEPLLDDPQFFAQALVAGPEEYVSHVLAVEGRPLYQLHIRYEMAGPALIRGNWMKPLRSVTLDAEPLPGLTESVVALLGYTGFGCLNYKLVGGRAQVFEFNPRFGASLTRAVNAALDAYLAALDAAESRTIDDVIEPDPGADRMVGPSGSD